MRENKGKGTEAQGVQMISKLHALMEYGDLLRSEAAVFFRTYAHVTYAVRVVCALCLGLLGIASVYAFIGVQGLGALRSALIGAVAGSVMVEEKPIVLSGVSVRGEVMPERELALSARASGVITSAPGAGQYVSEGDVVVRVDDTAAQRTFRAAEVALASARVVADMNRRASALALSDDTTARLDASGALAEALATGWDEAGEILVLLPDVVSGLSGMLYGSGFGDDENALMKHAGIIEADNEAISPLVARAGDSYVEAKRAYESAYALFHTESKPNDTEREELIMTTDAMLRTLAGAVDASGQLFTFIKNHNRMLGYQTPSVFDSYADSLANYEEQLNNQISIMGGTRALVEAAHAVMSGEVPRAPSPEFDELEIRRAEIALEEARAGLAAHELRAPFDGVMARVDARTSQYVSDGENVALLVSRTNVVRVYLAQGEAARVKVGTRVLVSIEGTDISVPGVVGEISGKGEKNADGDVVFTAVIVFPKLDERLRPGMEVRVDFEVPSTDLHS